MEELVDTAPNQTAEQTAAQAEEFVAIEPEPPVEELTDDAPEQTAEQAASQAEEFLL